MVVTIVPAMSVTLQSGGQIIAGATEHLHTSPTAQTYPLKQLNYVTTEIKWKASEQNCYSEIKIQVKICCCDWDFNFHCIVKTFHETSSNLNSFWVLEMRSVSLSSKNQYSLRLSISGYCHNINNGLAGKQGSALIWLNICSCADSQSPLAGLIKDSCLAAATSDS